MARVVLPIELTVLDQVRVTQVPSTFCGHGGEESVATFKNRVVSRVPVGIGEPKNPGTFGKKESVGGRGINLSQREPWNKDALFSHPLMDAACSSRHGWNPSGRPSVHRGGPQNPVLRLPQLTDIHPLQVQRLVCPTSLSIGFA